MIARLILMISLAICYLKKSVVYICSFILVSKTDRNCISTINLMGMLPIGRSSIYLEDSMELIQDKNKSGTSIINPSAVFKRIFSGSSKINLTWNTYSLVGFMKYLEGKDISNLSNKNIRKACIDYIIFNNSHNNYGDGQFFEIYENRRQTDLNELLSCLTLYECEVQYLKSGSDFYEGDEYFQYCEECEEKLSSDQGCISLQIEGRILCNSCFTY